MRVYRQRGGHCFEDISNKLFLLLSTTTINCSALYPIGFNQNLETNLEDEIDAMSNKKATKKKAAAGAGAGGGSSTAAATPVAIPDAPSSSKKSSNSQLGGKKGSTTTTSPSKR